MTIYVVIGSGVIIAAYRGERGLDLAGQHSRCLTGTTVVACDLLDSLPPEITEDLAVEFNATDDDDTLVVNVDELDD